jgi:hypothetical protein
MKIVKLRNKKAEDIQAKIRELSHGGLPRKNKHKQRLGRPENASRLFSQLQDELAVRAGTYVAPKRISKVWAKAVVIVNARAVLRAKPGV